MVRRVVAGLHLNTLLLRWKQANQVHAATRLEPEESH